jgi:hypothetical protein
MRRIEHTPFELDGTIGNNTDKRALPQGRPSNFPHTRVNLKEV